MQTTLSPQPLKKQNFIEKTRYSIPTFVVFVNAAGKIEEDK